MRQSNWMAVVFFYNEKHEMARKKIHDSGVNCLHECTCHEFFLCRSCLSLLKKFCYLVALTHYPELNNPQEMIACSKT